MIRLLDIQLPTPLVQLAKTVKTTWWRLVRPNTLAVRVLVRDEDDRLLLVRTTSSTGWSFPGGTVKRYEHPAAAACREVRDETGVEIDNEDIHHVGIYSDFGDGKSDTIILYRARCPTTSPHPRARHIAEAGFFDPLRLPESASPVVKVRLLDVQHPSRRKRDW